MIKPPYSIEPTTGLKTLPQLHFWKCLETKRCSKLLKIKNLCKNVFCLTLQGNSQEGQQVYQKWTLPWMFYCKNILLIANGRLPPKIQTVFFLNTKGSLWMDQKDFLEKLIIVAKRCWCRIIQEQRRVLNYKFLRRKKKKKIFAMPVLRDANV